MFDQKEKTKTTVLDIFWLFPYFPEERVSADGSKHIFTPYDLLDVILSFIQAWDQQYKYTSFGSPEGGCLLHQGATKKIQNIKIYIYIYMNTVTAVD